MRRVHQVLSAVLASISPQDRVFIASRLTWAEADLFYKMSIPDQRHCLNVAYTAARLADAAGAGQRRLLLKAALLHDVGRRRGDVSTADKIAAVLGRAVFGAARLRQWGRPGRGGVWQNLRHALFVSARHPELGANLLQAAGTEPDVIELVLRHHQPPAPEDSTELQLLRQADDLN
ncbi:MAG: HD domain-containing protein [Sporomusaceae bacterium]|nr:HD domain-containing protein [Sporomusaceae bacterium]